MKNPLNSILNSATTRAGLLFYCLALLIIPSVHANSLSYLTDAKAVGQARLTYLLWNVYDIELFAPNGRYSENEPAVLKLTYLRKLYGEKIAERSVEEIKKLGFSNQTQLDSWNAQMKAIFPDVKEGMALIGIYQPNSSTFFYSREPNGDEVKIGEISDPEFGLWFFRIWLSEQTSEPATRKKLLGLN